MRTTTYVIREVEPEQYAGADISRAFKAVASTIRIAKAELQEQGCPEQTMKNMLYGACTAAIEE